MRFFKFGKQDPGYGKKLTQEEFEFKVEQSKGLLPSNPTLEEKQGLRSYQINLLIDLRFGEDFPQDRRDQLCEVQKRLDNTPNSNVPSVQVKEFATVLPSKELATFFGMTEKELNRFAQVG